MRQGMEVPGCVLRVSVPMHMCVRECTHVFLGGGKKILYATGPSGH